MEAVRNGRTGTREVLGKRERPVRNDRTETREVLGQSEMTGQEHARRWKERAKGPKWPDSNARELGSNVTQKGERSRRLSGRKHP